MVRRNGGNDGKKIFTVLRFYIIQSVFRKNIFPATRRILTLRI